MSELHIFVSAVHCSCQHSVSVFTRLISQIKFISTLFIYFTIISMSLLLLQLRNSADICTNLRIAHTGWFSSDVIQQAASNFLSQKLYVAKHRKRISASVLERSE